LIDAMNSSSPWIIKITSPSWYLASFRSSSMIFGCQILWSVTFSFLLSTRVFSRLSISLGCSLQTIRLCAVRDSSNIARISLGAKHLKLAGMTSVSCHDMIATNKPIREQNKRLRGSAPKYSVSNVEWPPRGWVLGQAHHSTRIGTLQGRLFVVRLRFARCRVFAFQYSDIASR
jgi:hypothetical protein